MKKLLLFLIFACFSTAVKADEDKFYTISAEQQRQESIIQSAENIEDKTLSKTVIENEIYRMKYEMIISKQQMYKEIRRFKLDF